MLVNFHPYLLAIVHLLPRQKLSTLLYLFITFTKKGRKGDHTKVLAGLQGGGSGMVPGYPFPMTTSEWPEMALAGHPNLDQNIRKAVAEALFRLVELHL